MSVYRKAFFSGFTDVLWHAFSRLSLGLILVIVAVSSWVVFEGVQEYVGKEAQNFMVEHVLRDVLGAATKAVFIFQMVLALPLLGNEKFQGLLDSVWARPVDRGKYMLARALGRCLYFPVVMGLAMVGVFLALKKAGLPWLVSKNLVLQHLLFSWFSCLTAVSLMLVFACVNTTRLLHGAYWLLAYIAAWQMAVFLENTPGEGWLFSAFRGFAALWTSLVVGAPDSWIASANHSPWHIWRLLLSYTVGLSANTALLLALAPKVEVFHD